MLQTLGRRGKRMWAIAAMAALLSACAPVETVATGIGLLVLSPFIIASGLAQGLAFLPQTLGTDVDKLNEGLRQAKATSLDEAYRSLYGVSLSDNRVERRSGRIEGRSRPFRTMLEASYALQELLVEKGMDADEASHYLVCSIDTHNRSRGHILLSVVRRNSGMSSMTVLHKHSGARRLLRKEDPDWREPYRRTVDGDEIDMVVDWTGTEASHLESHKFVALLMVSAMESIKSGRRAPEYWQAERRWMNGESGEIIAECGSRGAVNTSGA